MIHSRAFGRKGGLYRIDTASRSVDTAVELSARPRGLCLGADSVWVACGDRYGGTIEKVDPGSGAMRTLTETEWPVNDLAIAADCLFVTMSVRLGGPIFDGQFVGVADGGGGGGGGDGGGGG